MSGEAAAEAEQAEGEDILDIEIRRGLSELQRPTTGLSLSGLSAGLDIGFGPLLMAVILTTAGTAGTGELTTQLLLALAYGIGFIFVVLGRSELFTEHTTLAVLPVLDGSASPAKLARLWGIVYVSNLVGAVVFGALIVAVGPTVEAVEPAALVELARVYTDQPTMGLLGGGVLAGWLMGLLTWLVAGADSTASRIFVVWLVATAIGVAHLPHCIAGSVEVVAGALASPALGPMAFARFLGLSTVGNLVGGTVFVALLKYGHVTRSGPTARDFRSD
ncbi:formate/nitrite transporter family protein [Haloarcula onubensis]|uniref:Formate/nitrite transporter family protein n=1 Tax=Haloarcula onubensis TaxID=2950539 RepID=A0ABU2FRD9_9EURY|nr:formate/nitrite transporter family protein [Halomicroarcula sp. S3CR25-11]MDS0283323.1 formate/nitrite transporter family protein [Halomicroarcula sp. S3CR25-11]